jgi:cytochrome b6-f complex iron-sulfur subunit
LSTTAKLALAAAGLAGSGALFAVARGSSPGGRRLVLGRLSLAIDSLVFLPEHNLFVVRTALGLGAFSARCTHLGCTVRQNGDGLVCPCHGAHYDRSGHVLGGPAPRDLPWLAVSLQADGQVVVEPREVESGTVTPLGAEHNL